MIGWALLYAALGVLAGWSGRSIWGTRETIVTMSRGWLKERSDDTKKGRT